MRAVFDLLSRFRKDERGAFAVIFAVIAIVLIAMSGAVVDFTAVQQARTRAQVALDAAALALQPTIYTTPLSTTQTTIQSNAQKLLVDRLADAATTWANCNDTGAKAPCAYVQTPVIDTTNGQLTLQATLKVPLYFVGLVGINSMSPTIISVATRKKLNLEVAMVLDNSGSMQYTIGYTYVLSPNKNNIPSRMATLQTAANCAANILFYGVTSCTASTTGLTANPNVKMAVVPFNDEVNVDNNQTIAKGTAAAVPSWLDTSGGSGSFNNDNFDNDDSPSTAYTANFSRLDIFKKIKDTKGNTQLWGGCVEARKAPYDTDDTAPDTSNKDTLFTPLFAPDEPDTQTCTTNRYGKTTCSDNFNNNYLSDTPSVCNWAGTCVNSIAAVATETKTSTGTMQPVKKTITTDGSGNVLSTTQVNNGSSSAIAATDNTTTDSTNTQTFTNTTTGTSQTGSSICTCTSSKNVTTGTKTTAGPTQTVVTTTTSTNAPGVSNGKTGSNKRYTITEYDNVSTYNTTQIVTPSTTTYTCTGQTYTPQGLSERVLQERICKYNVVGGVTMNADPQLGYGPNIDCPANPIQPLTNTPSLITSRINAMVANGNTNIQEGTAWGFRVLSPGLPFSEGDAYNNSTSKVMIVMTDGENTYSQDSSINGSGLYAAYAYPYNNYDRDTYGVNASDRGRLGDTTGWAASDFETAINTRLSTTCTNAKLAGITIYTIGLATANTSDPTGNTKLLTDCATQPSYAHFVTNATDLTQAFEDIANQLAALRLAQ